MISGSYPVVTVEADPPFEVFAHVHEAVKRFGSSYPGWRPGMLRYFEILREWNQAVGRFSPPVVKQAVDQWTTETQKLPSKADIVGLCKAIDRRDNPPLPRRPILDHTPMRRRPDDCPFEQLARMWERENEPLARERAYRENDGPYGQATERQTKLNASRAGQLQELMDKKRKGLL